jgi:hypothetical protein
METKPKKINVKVEVSMTEETLNALMTFRNSRGFPSLDETVSELIASKLGKSSTPMWTDSEILAIHEGGKAILKVLCGKAMSPAEIAQETGMGKGELRAHLAHLSRRYKKFTKEPLHVWNENIEKYEANPKYIEMLSRLLV